jgi:hypothetical protein
MRSARFVGQCANLVRADEWLVTVAVLSTGKKVVGRTKVGRCRLTVLKPVLKAPIVSALETII